MKSSAAWSQWSCLVAFLVAAACPQPGQAFTYERCELAKQLKNTYGFPMSQVPTFVCIAHRESKYNTAAVSKPNHDGSIDYGLFQINNRWWCNRGPRLGCGVTCDTLLRDMNQVAKCVKTIYAETKRLKGDGFKAWSTYKFCKSPASYVDGCGIS